MDDIRKLDLAVKDFINSIANLPPARLEPSKTTKYGPLEVLKHLTFWHEQYVSIATAILNHQKPSLRTGKFYEINAQVIKEYSKFSIAELINKLQSAQFKLSRIAKSEQSRSLKYPFKEGGTVRDFREGLLKIEGHFRSHMRQVHL